MSNPLRIATVGGFGHATCVFDELIRTDAPAGDTDMAALGMPQIKGEF